MPTYDVVVVGAGIVGLATTLALMKRKPDARIIVLDKEPEVAAHQTGAEHEYPPNALDIGLTWSLWTK